MQTAGPLLKQGRQLGIKAVFAFGDGAATDNMKAAGGRRRGGATVLAGGNPAAGASKKFLDAYKKRFSIEPILYSPSPTTPPTC